MARGKRRGLQSGLENGSREHGPSCTHHLPSSLPTPPATLPSIYRPADVASTCSITGSCNSQLGFTRSLTQLSASRHAGPGL